MSFKKLFLSAPFFHPLWKVIHIDPGLQPALPIYQIPFVKEAGRSAHLCIKKPVKRNIFLFHCNKATGMVVVIIGKTFLPILLLFFISKRKHMKTTTRGSHPVLSQTANNTTLWIGHLQADPTEHFAGQTFTCPTEGQLDNIQVFSAAVTKPGEVALTIHEFDPVAHSWGPSLGESRVQMDSADVSHWIRFDLEPVRLNKNQVYAFRLFCNDALIGLGEAAAEAKSPFPFGQSWNADTNNQKGNFFNYFSLAFKVEMCA